MPKERNLRLALAPWGETISEMCDAARAAEAGGFESVWTSELTRTSFIPATALGLATSRVQVGTAVALAFLRSPLITALSALDIDDLSEGRFVLGLGTGVRRLNESWHGAEFGKPAPHLRERIELIRRFIAELQEGSEISYEGEFVKARVRGFERPFPQKRDEIPIYIASVGPVLTRLAGEIADGWIAHELGSPGYLKGQTLPDLEKGLKRAGRDRSDLTVMVSAVCVPHSDSSEAKRRAAGLVAFYATVRTYSDFFEAHGFGPQTAEIQKRFREGDVQKTIEACPEEMVDALTLSGTPDEIRERIRGYEGLADVVKLSPPTHFVPADVTREAQWGILEMFSG
jgi:probable F420-dependent oxidoreductase